MRKYKQSQVMLSELNKKAFMKTSEECYSCYPPLFFKRVKGAYCYDLDGNKYADFNLNNGSLLFGHAPAFLTHTVKNAVSLGIMNGMMKSSLYRFYKTLFKRIPNADNYNFFIVKSIKEINSLLEAIDFEKTVYINPMNLINNSDDTLLKNSIKNEQDKGNTLIFDETDSSFCFEKGTFINEYEPDVSILNGSLGINVLAVKKGIEINIEKDYFPSNFHLQRASDVLMNLYGKRSPFNYIKKSIRQLKKSIENKITGYYGLNPIIKISNKIQNKALDEGFIVSGNGIIFLSSVHSEKLIQRFANFINKS